MAKNMNVKKEILAVILTVFFALAAHADDVCVRIEFTGIEINGGDVHISIFTNEQDHKKDIPFTSFILKSTDNIVVYELDLPGGECLIWGFQDANNNGKLDAGIFGIPKESIGLTNYSGKGVPGGFNKHKIPVNSTTNIVVVNFGHIKL